MIDISVTDLVKSFDLEKNILDGVSFQIDTGERVGLLGKNGAGKSTLAEMTAGGGRETEKDLFGNPGGYKVVLSKNTYADPCPVCGGALVKEAYLGGAVYYCPHCQPLK